MALDTFANRLSLINSISVTMPNGVYPTGTVDQAARQDFIWMYRGILAAPLVRLNEKDFTLYITQIFTENRYIRQTYIVNRYITQEEEITLYSE